MGKLIKKMRVDEVSLATMPKNKKKFILQKDKGGLEMDKLLQLLAMLVKDSDIPEVIKEELKETEPKLDTKDVLEIITQHIKKDDLIKELLGKDEKVINTAKNLVIAKDGKEKVYNSETHDVLEKDSYTVKEDKKYQGLSEDIRKEFLERDKRIESLEKDKMSLDIFSKVNDQKIADFCMSFYGKLSKDEIDSIAERFTQMQKTIKELGAKKGSDDAVIKETEERMVSGIEKIMKDEKVSYAQAASIWAQRNPEAAAALGD